jgi:hypothetical protein
VYRNEVFAFLGYYIEYVGTCLPTFRDGFLVPSSCVKESPLFRKVGKQQPLRNIPEERWPHLPIYEKAIKPYVVITYATQCHKRYKIFI